MDILDSTFRKKKTNYTVSTKIIIIIRSQCGKYPAECQRRGSQIANSSAVNQSQLQTDGAVKPTVACKKGPCLDL